MKKYQTQIMDWLIGLLYAVGTSVGSIIETSLQAHSFAIDWKQVGTVALTTAGIYIYHRFITDDVVKAQKTLDKVNDQNK